MSLSHPDWHLSVLTHSQLRWLCLLTQHTRAWRCGQSLSHGPWAGRGPKGSGEEGKVIFRGHSSGSPQLPSLYTLRPSGEWLKTLTTASLVAFHYLHP